MAEVNFSSVPNSPVYYANASLNQEIQRLFFTEAKSSVKGFYQDCQTPEKRGRPCLKTTHIGKLPPVEALIPRSDDSLAREAAMDPPFVRGDSPDGRRRKGRVCAKSLKMETHTPQRPKSSEKVSRMECSFCRRNGDMKSFYATHVLKDCYGRVVCPILREYVCEICGASGDSAHTRSYCPTMQRENCKVFNTVLLKRTVRNSTGKRKMNV